MTNIYDISLYRSCRRKRVDYWLCIPPKGTVVFNKFTSRVILQQLGKYLPSITRKFFISCEELKVLKATNQQLYNFIMQNCDVVGQSNNIVVLFGSEGEMWTTTYESACKMYKAYSYNTVVELASALNERVSKYESENVVDWIRVSCQDNTAYCAVFVLSKERGILQVGIGKGQAYNEPGVAHGRGDFIVCRSVNGKPDLSTSIVVNGLVFSNTYDNRGWQDYISISTSSELAPPCLWKAKELSERDRLYESLISWFRNVNMSRHVSFLESNRRHFTEKNLRYIQDIVNVLGYIMKKYDGVPEDSMMLSTVQDLQYLSVNMELPGNMVIIVSHTALCGYDYGGSESVYSEEPYEVDYNGSKESVDAFIKELSSSRSMYDRLRSVFRDSGDKSLLKVFEENYGPDYYKSTLNKKAFNCSMVAKFLRTLLDGHKLYGDGKIFMNPDCIDDSYLQFAFNTRGSSSAIVNYNVSTDGSIFAWSVSDNDDEFEFTLSPTAITENRRMLKSICAGDCVKDADKFKVSVSDNKLHLIGDVLITKDGAFRCESIQVNYVFYYINAWSKDTNIRDSVGVDRAISTDGLDVKSVSRDEFLAVMWSAMDKIHKRAMYALDTENFAKYDMPRCGLVVLGRSRVGRIYCRVETIFGDIYASISQSTLKMVQLEHPQSVRLEATSSRPRGVSFTPLYYYQLMLRLGWFAHAYNFKNVKLEYLKYNQDIFAGILDNSLICTAGNYTDSPASTFAKGTAEAHAGNNGEYITFNGTYHNLQSELPRATRHTLLHEMCHPWTKITYGTMNENPGEDGGTYYHIPEVYKPQWIFHGKHFGEAVQLVVDKTGIPFAEIFGYEIGETSDPDPNNTSSFRTLNMRNAYNFGQTYRRFPLGEFKDSQYCIQHGELNCKCTTGEKISIPRGRYVGVCRHCGKMLAYTDDDLSSISPVSVEYLDVIDRLGVVACSSCAKCGGSIRPVIPKDDNNYDLFSAYLSDMSFAKRYVEHIYSVCMRNSNKYNAFFMRNYGCQVSFSKGVIPYLDIVISNGSDFREAYKFFVTCTVGHKPIGSLYKDYGMEEKGRRIHNFRLNTNKNITDFLEYVMSYIRQDLRQ